MAQHMITTKDNPYDYFTQFKEWFTWDTREGYNTLALLARVAVLSPELPDAAQEDEIEWAVNEIAEQNVSGVHIKIPIPMEFAFGSEPDDAPSGTESNAA